MRLHTSAARLLIAASAVAMFALAGMTGGAQGQAPAPAAQGQPAGGRGFGGGGGGRGGGPAGALYAVVDANKDGCAARAELKTTFDNWFAAADASKTGSITNDQLVTALKTTFPTPAAPGATAAAPAAGGGGGGGFGGGRGGGQNQTPIPCDVELMTAALPDKAPAKPAKPRQVLVLAKAQGFVHSSIPLAAKTVEALGTKTGAWTTTITYDPKDINAANLAKYDLVFLDSNTGCFLDEPGDPVATADRRAALLAFVRSGKGVAGIHAATDSYHSRCPNDPPPADGAAGGRGGRGAAGAPGAPAVPGGVVGGVVGGQIITAPAPAAPAPPAPSTAETLGSLIMKQGDKNADAKLSKAEFSAVADAWFDQLDTLKQGKVRQSDFSQRFAAIDPQPAGAGGGGGRGGRGAGGGNAAPVVRGSVKLPAEGTWPEYNKMVGGYFKFHWGDGTHVPVKIDDTKSPLTKMFDGKGFEIIDETYTFAQDSFSRNNVHVLTSVDYDKMPQATKDQETAGTARTDGDYALSYIRREGQGRVFYEANGHNEKIYMMRPMLEHVLAGIQYALGDLKADDTPSGYKK